MSEAVFIWQLLVFASVGLGVIKLKKKAIFIPIGWTAWSFIMLSATDIAILQVFVAWSTFFIARIFFGKDANISDTIIDNIVSNLPGKKEGSLSEEINKDFLSLPTTVQETITKEKQEKSSEIIFNKQHFDYLYKAIRECTNTLVISSGWLSSQVIDSKLIGELEGAMARGVEIFIGYGFKDFDGRHNSSRSSRKALMSLLKLQSQSFKFKGSLIIGKYNNHVKTLIIDKKVLVHGSHNWLSNAKFDNEEASIISHNVKAASEMFNYLVGRIKGNIIRST